jgi:MoCo/4Fe-4S cofactor protein with predicted Tat translocation signal
MKRALPLSTESLQPTDLAAFDARFDPSQEPSYWRSLDERARTEAFQMLLQNEFPEQASEWHDPVSRRRFMQLMGASIALAGLTACTRQPEESIVPFVQEPESTVPGKPKFYATSVTLGGWAQGVLVESHMGRPTKIEGNPQHPASLGAADAFGQASVLSLYDPDRSQAILQAGQIRTWKAFVSDIGAALEAQRVKRGRGLRILTETVSSPTLAHQLQALQDIFPEFTWHQYEPVNQDAVRAGTRLAFGRPLNPVYRFDRAEVILTLDAEIFSAFPGALRYVHDFSAKRRVRDGSAKMNRLYSVESTPTLTGSMADHRLPMRASAIGHFAHGLAQAIGALDGTSAVDDDAPWTGWRQALVDDLKHHRGRSLIVAGDQQPADLHALAHLMNHALDNIGTTVVYTAPVEAQPTDQLASLTELTDAMASGKVELLLILGGNPVYTALDDLNFAQHLTKVNLRAHLSLYDNETSELCNWHIPAAHDLEAWGDCRAYDGSVSLIQPLIEPLYGGKSAHELLATLMGDPTRKGYEIVKDYWQSQHGETGFAPFWRKALHDGVMPSTALQAVEVAPQPFRPRALSVPDPEAIELIFRPDPTIWDGRFANNGWLQELPKPLSKLTWDNAALMSPALAERLGLDNEDTVELRYQERTVTAPVWRLPGHVDHAVTVYLGYGRWRAGRTGTGTGFNAYRLRTSSAPGFDTGLEIRRTGNRYPLATTQQHHNMEGRHLVREATLAHFQTHPHFVHDLAHDPPDDLSLFPPHPYDGYAWGMVVDLNACIGCNACTIACQSENNIPIVGKTEVARGREMHWLRIDRYYSGSLDNPSTYHQPVMCMHCEHAPCEVVCPVAATSHSDEGLNDMVYNRCVGTRYCSNNCPYKVRRFNFFHYADYETPSLKLMRNPDVTVRTRGVMEKCTYCVQRINASRIQAKLEDRSIRDGDIVTACQATCPTGAIVFGDINDPKSRVAQLKAAPLNYALLTELNTRPRTSYLAKLRNPNPALETPGRMNSNPH